MDKFLVNTRAVLFHDYLDKRNGYNSVVCNPKTETYLKINQTGYKILRIIDEDPGITLNEILNTVKVRKEVIEKFILAMVGQNVVFTK